MEIVNLLFVLIFINYVFFIGLLICGFSKVKTFGHPELVEGHKSDSEGHPELVEGSKT